MDVAPDLEAPPCPHNPPRKLPEAWVESGCHVPGAVVAPPTLLYFIIVASVPRGSTQTQLRRWKAWGVSGESRWHSIGKTLLPSPVGTGEPSPELVFTGSSRPGQVWLGPLHGPPVLHRHCDCPLGPAPQIQTKVLLADDAVCTTWISAHLSPRLAPLCLQEQWVWGSLFVFFRSSSPICAASW